MKKTRKEKEKEKESEKVKGKQKRRRRCTLKGKGQTAKELVMVSRNRWTVSLRRLTFAVRLPLEGSFVGSISNPEAFLATSAMSGFKMSR